MAETKMRTSPARSKACWFGLAPLNKLVKHLLSSTVLFVYRPPSYVPHSSLLFYTAISQATSGLFLKIYLAGSFAPVSNAAKLCVLFDSRQLWVSAASFCISC